MRAARSSSGFSLVEVMVAASLLTLGVIGFHYFYTGQMKQEQGAVFQLEAHVVLAQATSMAAGSSIQFVPAVRSDGKVITYVACYDDKARPRKNIFGISGFFPRFLEGDVRTDASMLSTICPPSDGIEAHVTPLPTGNEALIDAIVSVGNAQRASAARKVFRTRLQLDSPL